MDEMFESDAKKLKMELILPVKSRLRKPKLPSV